MKIATLYDCFDRHLTNLHIECESEEQFVVAVVEKYLINMGGLGYSFGSHAEDTFNEFCDEVKDMLRKKIYGYMNVDEYRNHLRDRSAA